MIVFVPILLAVLCVQQSAFSGESVPEWLQQQIDVTSIWTKPGVYPLRDARLLVVGVGKIPSSMGQQSGRHYALSIAENEAKFTLGKYLYPKMYDRYKKVSITIVHALKAFEHISEESEHAYIGLVVEPEKVTATPILDKSIIVGAVKVDVPDDMLIYLEDPLLQLGGGKIYAHDDGWIVIGVGEAMLNGQDSTAIRAAHKTAAAKASTAIIDAVFGSSVTTQDTEGNLILEQNGIARMESWLSTHSEQVVRGALKQVTEVGTWTTEDGYLFVASAVSDRPLNIGNPLDFTDEDVIPAFSEWNVSKDWEFHLLDHPGILRGGTTIVAKEDSVWALGVGAARLTGNPANDRIHAPKASETDAQRNILKYIKGFTHDSHTKDIEEISVELDASGKESSVIVSELQTKLKQNTSGFMRKQKKVGSWQSEDGKLLYHAVAVELMNIQ